MSNTRTLVDPLGPLKTWLRAQNVDEIGQRVYIGDPTGATLPYVALMLVDGAVDPGEAQMQTPRIQVCVQAATESDASDAMWATLTTIDGIKGNLDATLRAMGARLVLGPIPRLDESGPRYLAEVEITVVAR